MGSDPSESWRNKSNLNSFLHKTTPFVPSQSLPKTFIRENSHWQPIGKDTVDFFSLGDIWDQYYEWSAYGLGVPVRLPIGETAVQYYVPYLSAIQIYTSKSLAALRNVGEDSESDSWSDDSESEKHSKSWDATSEDSSSEPDGSWPARDRLGHLYFQYVEYCPPYGRIPLIEKVTELARTYPGLISFKSVDLSPASWMSVSWYPIYHIPFRRSVKDLSACFLTYHTISSSFQDSMPGDSEKDFCCTIGGKNGKGSAAAVNRIPLPPFGLATYKAQENFWLDPESEDQERFATLYSAADSG
ncbi:uncharacterized protein M6B38_307685 [Iris pallida]|uniref:Uncharacterized protein n=1 Tax=Iris pallida TaxID=29817 RepID=A0AAX6EPQ5_IRIPA|nr:uncharacterized protein M6B38_176415 [Iris pallida]KAJ6841258.1 uncharacterized protein M6B38_307685 [Iris pallida]